MQCPFDTAKRCFYLEKSIKSGQLEAMQCKIKAETDKSCVVYYIT